MPASSRDMNIPVLATLGGVSTILVFVIIVATQAWFRNEVNRELQAKVIERSYEPLNDQRRAQLAQLEGYAVTDPERGVARIPIEKAMGETVKMYANRGGGQPTP